MNHRLIIQLALSTTVLTGCGPGIFASKYPNSPEAFSSIQKSATQHHCTSEYGIRQRHVATPGVASSDRTESAGDQVTVDCAGAGRIQFFRSSDAPLEDIMVDCMYTERAACERLVNDISAPPSTDPPNVPVDLKEHA